MTAKVTRYIKFGLIGLLIAAATFGAGAFYYQHRDDIMTIQNAKVAGTMVSVRVLTNGKISELTHTDGDVVEAGDVIARIHVSITEEEIMQLENSVELAKNNYAELEQGQIVKVEVRRPVTKTIVTPRPGSQRLVESPQPAVSAGELAALEERKNRMEKLYEMGAISRVQKDAAVQEYELARSAAYSYSEPTYEYVPDEEPLVETQTEYEVEYVDQLQPTPPEILEGARLAIKQAEMSLNTARQEAQLTEVIAPVSGTIYYNAKVEDDITAGNVIAKVGDSNELWLEAEVSEDQFYRLPLGKLVSYVINGNTLKGTIIDKIAPEPIVETPSVDENAISDVETATPINDIDQNTNVEDVAPTNDELPPADTTDESIQTSALDKYTGVGGPYPILIAQVDPIDNDADPIADVDQSSTNIDPAAVDQPNEMIEQITDDQQNDMNNQAADVNIETPTDVPNTAGIDQNPPRNDKFIVRFSLPNDRNFECRPNMTATVTIYDPIGSWLRSSTAIHQLISRFL